MTIQPPSSRVHLPLDALDSFCRKWRVQELALFGSVLREDFSPESDVDVLVTFDQEAPWSLWEVLAMRGELNRCWAVRWTSSRRTPSETPSAAARFSALIRWSMQPEERSPFLGRDLKSRPL